jgi:hypothetical protein
MQGYDLDRLGLFVYVIICSLMCYASLSKLLYYCINWFIRPYVKPINAVVFMACLSHSNGTIVT